ncbi:MAG TPA: glycosyltransferase family 2 protein [Candidatus Merdisoma merdipullorum]|nr:glycosyltransferase family 2 protein [Candidatus Merdisoma merdipullorum]
MRNYGIVVIGYNRKKSMERLLETLDQAEYGNTNVLLIISLDYANMPEIVDTAEKYVWRHGRKIVNAYTEKQGLRKHILSCGEYMEKYDLDAIAVFEDDIFPSPAFFNYMCQAVEFYKDTEEIAGISLYTHLWNVNYQHPFQPLPSKYDTFFMQYAQSWGQIWLPKQWKDFREWYEENHEPFWEAEGVPSTVCHWRNSSWLKYHIRYCVEKKKYFVYPYESLATNFTEIGTHNKYKTALYQVPLQTDSQKKYNFASLEDSQAVYDAFFENERIAQDLNLSPDDLCVDLYGSKPVPVEKKYWLTTRKEDYRAIKTYGLSLRPQELNIKLDVSGKEIKLYDLEIPEKNRDKTLSMYQYFDYYYRLTHAKWKALVVLLLERILIRLKR